jgi:hypothetical protein
MAMYDHILFLPFRNRIEECYDLLRPKLSFFNMLLLTSCTVVWMVTVLLASVLSSAYLDISTIQLGVFIAVTVGISIISSILNYLAINRLVALYMINIKGAFQIHYGHEFLAHYEQE